MKYFTFFIIFISLIDISNSSEYSDCGEYFFTGEVVQVDDGIRFIVNKHSISQVTLKLDTVEAISPLISFVGENVKVKASISRKIANYHGEIDKVSDVSFWRIPKYKESNPIELITKNGCSRE